tara:strand:- start:2483 stop:2794 length:312 start_codon:yes stop_codon:yes gene_type:complete
MNEKIRVRLESFNHHILTLSCQKIDALIQAYNIDSYSLVPLPTDKRIYCVLRSPHVDKDSREHFEIRMHKRIIDISYNSEIDIIDVLSKSNLPPGVLYQICLP